VSTRAACFIARALPSIVACCFAAASPAWATKPAVRSVNGQVFGGYAYDEAASATVSEGGSSVYVPTDEVQGWQVGGILTVPVVHWLGARIAASGGLFDVEQNAGSGFTGSDADEPLAEGSLELFVRDPEIGTFGLGYRFGWSDPPGVGDRLLENALLVDVGVYIPDQGLGPIDWRIRFDYGRGKLGGEGASDTINGYRLHATSGWYPSDFWRFTGGFRFELEDPEVALPGRDLRGTAELAWLLPIGERPFVTLRFDASGGRARDDLPAPFSYADRAVWAVGGAIDLSWPGATSLVELTRELH
jgi:hypothetical protein